ncbi:MAG: hypothetical protein OXS50_08970 [Gammaproteobacteria bacterium]|nr:hypothetical protein [Gammaproteobacteria bacterium]
MGGIGGYNDTLVVETKNFKERTGLYGGDAADDGNRRQREHFVQRLPKNGKPACFPRLPVQVALAHELVDLVTDARAR